MTKGVIVLCVVLFHVWCTVASTAIEDINYVTDAAQYIGRSDRLEEALSHTHQVYRNTRQGSVKTNRTAWNCSRLYDASYGYNYSSCRFIQENCQSKFHLMNYLAFMKCTLPTRAQVRHLWEHFESVSNDVCLFLLAACAHSLLAMYCWLCGVPISFLFLLPQWVTTVRTF